MRIIWSERAWEDYLWWQQNERHMLKRINSLIPDIQRNGYHGIGKPEMLRHLERPAASRRITAEHRLVYYIEDDVISIAQCRYHYE